MTREREEALEELKEIRFNLNYKVNGTSRFDKALNIAIKLLEQEPCEDAISRQAVLEAIDAKAWEFCDYLISKGRNDEQKPVSHFADNLRECVGEDLPSVSAQPKMGKWLIKRVGDYDHAICSVCGDDSFLSPEWDALELYKYCPNCGSYNGGEQE